MKILITIIMSVILMTTLVSAFEFDNSQKILETYGKAGYKDIEIKNCNFWVGTCFIEGKVLWSGTLDYNTESCRGGRYCEAIQTITLHEKGSLVDELITKTLQEDGSWIEQPIRSYELYANDNLYELGTELDAGIYEVRLKGEKKPTRTIEWIYKTQGELLESWATWSSSSPTAQDLVAYWSFDENAGLTAQDNVTGNFDQTLIAPMTTNNWTTGILGNAIIYNGTGGYSTFENGSLANAVNWSLNFWMKPDVVGSASTMTFSEGIEMDALNKHTAGDFQLDINDVFDVYVSEYTTDWNMITITYDQSNTNLTIYRNGNATDSKTVADGQFNRTTGNRFGINYDGLMDETGLWKRTLSQSDIDTLYNSGSALAYPLSDGIVTLNSPGDNSGSILQEVKFNGSATLTGGSTLVNVSFFHNASGTFELNQSFPISNLMLDSSGNSNDGTVTNVTLGSIGGGSNQFYGEFDGESSYVEVNDSDSLETENITISVWINSNVLDDDKIIMAKSDSVSDSAWVITAKNSGQKAQFRFNSTGSDDATNTLTSASAFTGWTFLTFVVDTISLNISINGIHDVGLIVNDNINTTTTSNIRIGNYRDLANRFFNGSIDEVLIYNRSLNQAEITALFNQYTLTANGPIRDSEPSTTGQVLNMNFDQFLGGTAIFNTTLPDGFTLWNYRFCDSDGDCGWNPTNFTVNIDSQAPIIVVNNPFGTLDYGRLGFNETLNWTITELSIDTILFNYDGINTTIFGLSNSTNFTLTNTKNITIWANDTSGNLGFNLTEWEYRIFENARNFTKIIAEGGSDTFMLNFTLGSSESISSAFLNYNNTNFAAEITTFPNNIVILDNPLEIPNVGIDRNVSFLWIINLASKQVNTSSSNQTVLNFGIGNCTDFGTLIINYTLRDEEFQNILGGIAENTSIEVDVNISTLIGNQAVAQYSNLFNRTNPALVCVKDETLNETSFRLDAQVRYISQDRQAEFHNIQNFTLNNKTIPQNINLFDLLSADAQVFTILFKDGNFLPVEDALIDIQRKYIAEGIFKSVEIPITDRDGIGVASLVLDNVIYNIVVSKNGNILGTFRDRIAVCDNLLTGDCSISLNEIETGTPMEDFQEAAGINFVTSINQTTRTISILFTTTDGSSANMALVTNVSDNFGTNLACDDSLVSSTGTLTCVVPNSVGNTTVISELIRDGEIVRTFQFSLFDDPADNFGGSGLVMALVFVMAIPFLFITDPRGLIIGGLMGFVVVGMIGLVVSGAFLAIGSSFTWAVVIAAIGIWKITEREK